MKHLDIEYLSIITGVILFLIGLWGILSQKNIIKLIISFSIIDTSTHLLLVSIGYLKNRTAPIIESNIVEPTAAMQKIVDPVPQALVLTAIVIGVGVTALMLTYALRLYKEKNSLEIDKYISLKW